jgi:inner membrane protein
MIAGVIGGIFPDFDFIYHIFIDSDRTPHHQYLTHLPLFWAGVWAVLFLIGVWKRDRRFMAVVTTFCASAMLHLVFDTLTGVVYWFKPLSSLGVNVFKVADVHVWWVRNYVDHWTFLFEIAIIVTAMIVFLRVKESVAMVAGLLRQNVPLRQLLVRITICVFGAGLIILVGSLEFNIDNKLFHKAVKLKHKVARSVPAL